MRLTVTPIGASGSSSAAVAAAVVDYLQGEQADPGVGLLDGVGGEGAAAYYADSVEGPGRWLGAGAAFQRLRGTVDRDAFQRVLEGRHPYTGERLLTAQGSSQRGHLAVGTAARFDEDGQPLYSVSDAARLLGLARKDVVELIETGSAGERHVDDRGWIAATGPAEEWIPDVEITRHLELAARPASQDDVLAGDPDELLTVTQTAGLLGVTPRYVRRLCAAHHQPAPENAAEQRRAALSNVRDEDAPGDRYRVRRGDVAAFAAARKAPVARVGFDVTLTCEKSIGVVMMLSSGERQRAFVRALRVANDTAVAHLDRVASTARRRGQRVHSEGLVAASYFHGTSRLLDPHPHFHNVVANAVVDDVGEVRTLDARALYRHAPTAAALATAAARWELRDLDIGWRKRDDDVWEIAGVSDEVIREFSRRRNEMDEVRAVLEAQLGRPITHAEEDTVALSTRAGKEAVDATEVLDGWRQRAGALGFDVDACFNTADRPLVCDALPADLVRRLFDDLTHPDSGMCADRDRFDRGDVICMIADWAVAGRSPFRKASRKVLLPPDEIERLADQFCASDLVVQLDPAVAGRGVIRRRDGTVLTDAQPEPVYVTVELLEVEADIVSVHDRGLAVGAGVVPAALLRRAVDAAEAHLSEEQVRLVRSWCTSGHRVQPAIGRAGTGKTTTMRVAAAAWRAAGYRVIGAAIKGEAARQLAHDAGIEADTLALLLTEARFGRAVLDERTVLILDEASTIGDRDLADVLRLVEKTGATVRLIGDPAQHGSVAVGGSFTHLASIGDTPELTQVWRLLDAGERQRAELIRDGRIAEALDQLEASKQLVLTDSDADTYAAMLTRWYQHRQDDDPHPMVHGRNRERRLLNQLAQAVLAADGAVDVEQAVVTSDGRRLCVGDDVIARHGDRGIHPNKNPAAWMRNGTTGRIVALHHAKKPANDRIIVRTDHGLLDCPRKVFDRRRGGIDLAYAVTSYAVQGSTRSGSTSAVTVTTARSELYVDITRGRSSNQVYGTRDSTLDGEEHLPQEETELLDGLRGRLGRAPTRIPFAADPLALDIARLRKGRTLPGLIAALRRGEHGATHAAVERATTAIRQHARTHPPRGITAVLPARPTSPHLAARWDTVAGDVAVHRTLATTPRRPVAPRAGLERVLGPRPTLDRSQDWDRLADKLVSLAVDVTAWHLDHHQNPDVQQISRRRPAWLTRHLVGLAQRGQLVDVDHERLAHLVNDVHNWRRTHDLIGRDEGVLGDPPRDPADRWRYEQLARRLGQHDTPSGRAAG